MDVDVCRIADLATRVGSTPGQVRLVGIDGCGGAGKTTLAARLSAALGGAPVVHTDDFATHDAPTQWWPMMLRDVVEPLLRGEPAAFRPYDWATRRRRDQPTRVDPADAVIVEGVGATHSAWRDRLALRVWVDAPREVRLARGIARDGEALRDFWESWMVAEDAYASAEQPWRFADVVVDGAPTVGYDETTQYVELRGLSAPR